jgi:Zn-dependent protease/CBS domain-containing protein
LLTIGGTLVFVASILVHELAHGMVARLRGMPVSHIRLYIFGGTAYTSVESARPLDELLVTAVGPLSSAAIGAVLIWISRGEPHSLLAYRLFLLLLYLGWWNLFLAVFNLLPGLPLDGGRVFHAAIWKLARNRNLATRIAGRTGQGISVLLIAGGVALFVSSSDFRELWLSFIGWQLFAGATAELAFARREQFLRRPIRDLMTPPPPAVPADLSIAQAKESFLAGHEDEAFPVMEAGRVVGFIAGRNLTDAAPEGKVREVMREEPGVIQAGPDDTLDAVNARAGERYWQAIVVVGDGRLLGVVERAALTAKRRWRR